MVGILRSIPIACALIDDDLGRLLLVRKKGTPWFMQAGGKVEPGEEASAALRRELREELGLSLSEEPRHLGRVIAPAANEANCTVDAEIFHIRLSHIPVAGSEIEEAAWFDRADAELLPLAPLTREHILPLSRALYDPPPGNIHAEPSDRYQQLPMTQFPL